MGMCEIEAGRSLSFLCVYGGGLLSWKLGGRGHRVLFVTHMGF